jgi:Fic family protein
VRLEGCEHQPPDHAEVSHLVSEMCQHVEDSWHEPAVHLASYLMWRINWIHPFFGGNGRTSRAASYLILCAKLGFVLPGEVTIPASIVSSRERYYKALRGADAAWASEQKLNLSAMEELMEDLLAEQLVSIHEKATGKKVAPKG